MNHSGLKILHTHFGKDGGAERFFVNLATAFSNRGIEQKFVIRPKRIWADELRPHGQIIENNFRRVSVSGQILKLRIDRLVNRWKPDVVMGWMPRGARLVANWPEPVKLVRLGDFPKSLKHFSNLDVVVGNVPGIVERCKKLGWAGRTATVSNFAREVPQEPVSRKFYDTPQGVPLIAGAGRFVPRKGFDLLIKSFAELPSGFLWLIGDGQERQNLEALAQELGVADRVRFTGWIAEPSPVIAAADVFAMPSRHEPLGNSVFDAWAAKVPVASTRSEGPDWFMEDEVNGLLVEIDDQQTLTKAISRLINEPALRAKVVKGGQERLANWFSEDAIVEQYLSLFKDIADSKSRS
jgi:glycosyltransferase involved in cell wall biosynthesis